MTDINDSSSDLLCVPRAILRLVLWHPRILRVNKVIQVMVDILSLRLLVHRLRVTVKVRVIMAVIRLSRLLVHIPRAIVLVLRLRPGHHPRMLRLRVKVIMADIFRLRVRLSCQ